MPLLCFPLLQLVIWPKLLTRNCQKRQFRHLVYYFSSHLPSEILKSKIFSKILFKKLLPEILHLVRPSGHSVTTVRLVRQHHRVCATIITPASYSSKLRTLLKHGEIWICEVWIHNYTLLKRLQSIYQTREPSSEGAMAPWHHHHRMTHDLSRTVLNKLASLEATLVRNFDSLTDWRGEVQSY